MQNQQPNQRPPQLGQQPVRPMFRPQGAPAGFRPPMQPRPGFQPTTGGTPPPHPGHPGVRPSFVPNQVRPMMRPVGQSPIQSPAVRPASPVVASPIQQHQQVEPPMSPTTATSDHHRRKRMYPEQIAKAYSGDVPVSPGYPPQQQSYGSPAMTNQQPMQQQAQFISPMGTPSTTYVQPSNQPYLQQQQQQQQPQQQQQQQPAYNAYNQDPVNQMSSQFGNMNMGSPMAPVGIIYNFFYKC